MGKYLILSLFFLSIGAGFWFSRNYRKEITAIASAPLKKENFLPKRALAAAPRAYSQNGNAELELNRTIVGEARKILSRLTTPEGMQEAQWLDRQFAALIARDEQAIKRWALAVLKNLDLPSQPAFFLVRGLLRHAKEPLSVVQGVLDTIPPALAEHEVHHASRNSRLGMLKTYVLELLDRERGGSVGSQRDHQALETSLVRLAKTDPNLAVVREALLWLKKYSEDGPGLIAEILAARQPEERDFLEN